MGLYEDLPVGVSLYDYLVSQGVDPADLALDVLCDPFLRVAKPLEPAPRGLAGVAETAARVLAGNLIWSRKTE